jgi:hypothetical protein
MFKKNTSNRIFFARQSFFSPRPTRTTCAFVRAAILSVHSLSPFKNNFPSAGSSSATFADGTPAASNRSSTCSRV